MSLNHSEPDVTDDPQQQIAPTQCLKSRMREPLADDRTNTLFLLLRSEWIATK